MNVVKTIFRIKPKESKKKKKNEKTFNNEFYIASNEFSKQKLISYYGIEDCAITSGLGSCVKLESIFGASTISRGSSSTLTNSNITLSSRNSINKKNNSLKNLKGEEKLKKKDKKDKSKKSNNKKNKKDEIIKEKELEKEEENEYENENGKTSSISELELNRNNSIKKSNTLGRYQNETINNTNNELNLKLMERNYNNENNDNDKSISNLKNDLTSSETIYKNSESIDYLSNNPEVVIDINTFKNGEEDNDHYNLPTYINRSKSSIQINNMNINNKEEELDVDSSNKEKITIDIDTPTKIATVTTNKEKDDDNNENDNNNDNKYENEEEKEKERNIRYVNHLYTKKFNELNNKKFIDELKLKSHSSTSHSSSPSTSSYTSSSSSSYSNSNNNSINQHILQMNEKSKSEDSLHNTYLGVKNYKSFELLTPTINNSKSYKNKLSKSTESPLYNTNNDYNNLYENQNWNRVFLNKLVDRYSPQQRLSVSFNHLYNPLFVSNSFSKHYDMELKCADLSIRDIYEHGLPYLLHSKRPLIEFCKELIKEHQIEILFFINEVCNFQKNIYIKSSDILADGKKIYSKYLSNKAICPLEVNQSLIMKCVKDLKCMKKECFHAIAIFFYENLDFIYEEFKSFVLKEHYETNTEFDTVLISQKTDEEKQELEDDLIKLVEVYYKSNDEALIKKKEFIIESIKDLCKNLFN